MQQPCILGVASIVLLGVKLFLRVCILRCGCSVRFTSDAL